MKKIFSAAMISLGLCVLCACGKGRTGIRGEEVAQINCETDFKNFMVSGKDGYYLFCNGLIARWDGDVNHTAVPLCSRPNCSHDSEACFSFVQTLEKKIFYIDENIYIFGYPNISSVTKEAKCPLWKISADGSGKEIVLYASDWPSIYTIFQDDVYYGLQKEDENGKSVCCVARQPLSGGEETLVWTSDLQAGSFTILQGIGDRYDYDGNLKQEIQMAQMDDNLEWIPATEQYVFGYYETGQVNENGQAECAVVLLEREKFADGTAEMIPLIRR